MSDNGLHESDIDRRGLAVGIFIGILATFAVYSVVYFYTVTGYCVSCSAAQTVQTVLTILVCGLSALATGALAGFVAGQREILVASGSGFFGLILLGFMPDSFADPLILIVSSVPFLFLVLIGGEIVRSRRTNSS